MKRNISGISPIISIVIIVSVSIAIAISVALWMSGIIGGFTKHEKLELKAAYAEYVGQQNWNYRIPITITERSGNDLTDYSILVVVDTASLINAGKMKSDGGDIRFYASDGTTPLPYWIESGLGTSTTKIWVKVPSIPSNDETTIFMYYGNPQATSQSDPEATFQYFVIFSKYEILSAYGAGQDQTPDQWEIVDNSLHMWGNNWKAIEFPTTINGDGSQILELYMKGTDTAEIYGVGFDIDLNSPVSGTTYKFAGSQNWGLTPDGPYTDFENWQLVYAILNDFSGSYNYMIFANDDDADSNGNVWFKNVRIRKYVSPEPSVSLGIEEVIAFSGWIVNIFVTNNGEVDATISSIFINGRDITSFPQVFGVNNKDTGEIYYNSTVNEFEEGVPIKTGETVTFQIYITLGGTFKHGSNIEIKIKTASGQEYPKTIQLP